MEDALSPVWLSPFNPTRPVNWRWRCAQALAAATRGHKPRGRTTITDPDVLQAAAYLKSGEQSDRPVCGDLALLRQAIDLEHSDRAVRLEARLLAGLSIEETAVAEGLNAETVRLFAALFFDVLDCLDAFDYIHFIAIDFQPFACQPPGRNTLIKLMAYHGGPYVLNQLLALGHRS